MVLTRSTRVAGLAAAFLLLSGCATQTGGTPTPEDTPPPANATADAQALDEDTCSGYADVITIMNNTEAAVSSGRMSADEQQGWLRLATRVQDRIPSANEGPIAVALTELKDAAPAIPSGSVHVPGIRSDEWMTAASSLREACDAAGYEVTSEGFVGG
jgi:hypothetical protein